METENETRESLEKMTQLLGSINTALALKPELIKLVPHIEPLIEMLSTQIDKILKDNEQMIVITRRNGVSRAIVLNTKIDFTLSNDMKINSPNGNPIINNYEKETWKNKLLDHPAMQMLREKYEKMGGAEIESGESHFDGLFNMFSK